MDLVALQHVESPPTRDQTCVSCIGRQVVNHWTTKEIPIFFFFCCDFSVIYGTSLVAQTVKRQSTMQETWVRSLGQEDPLEKEMAIHSSTIAWKIPWTEEPGRLQYMGSQRVRHDGATSQRVSGVNELYEHGV